MHCFSSILHIEKCTISATTIHYIYHVLSVTVQSIYCTALFTGYIFHKQIVSDTCICIHVDACLWSILYSRFVTQHTAHSLHCKLQVCVFCLSARTPLLHGRSVSACRTAICATVPVKAWLWTTHIVYYDKQSTNHISQRCIDVMQHYSH